jgi:NADH dehydrogenase
VVVGGGFAGFWAAVSARRVVGPEPPIRLINAGPDLVMRPRLYEAEPASLSFPLAAPLASIGVEVIVDRAIAVEPGGGPGSSSSSGFVELHSDGTLGFDALVLATGSRMRRPPVAGASEAFSIDDQPDAMAFDDRLAQIAWQPEVRIAVVGAGFTGIELTLELPERLRRHGRRDVVARPEIVLVDRAAVVGAELGAGPRPVIEAALAETGVVCRLGATIESLSATSIGFADGTSEEFDAVVLCTGLVANNLDAPLPGPTDPLGRYRVDATLAHPLFANVFVAGDLAAVDTGTGHQALQSCQHALRIGRIAGENAARYVLGRDRIGYHQPDYVTCLDLGPAGAVLTRGWDRDVVESGPAAKSRKELINQQVIYPDLSAGADGLLAQSKPASHLERPLEHRPEP